MIKKYVFPEKYQVKISSLVSKLGLPLEKPTPLAKAILDLSNHYQNSVSTTPWETPEMQAAYLAYFFPLNYLRNLKVLDQISPDFFNPIDSIIDFGFGVGTASLSLTDHLNLALPTQAIESSSIAYELYHSLKESSARHCEKRTNPNLSTNTLGLFSYSLNELSKVPNWLFDCESIIILEPSTKLQGRRLMDLRRQLIDNDFFIWAPCTHQQACPLLSQSKQDWCHDRIHWQMPSWFKSIEDKLPIKNKTLTTSYIVASQRKPPESSVQGRIVGDPLREKGKTRWLFCRNHDREFLSWLKKMGTAPDWQRGELVNFKISEKKGNEIRFTSPSY